MSATLRACLLLIVVGAAAFSNSLHNPLLLDDFDTVADNPQIKQLGIENFKPERELPVAGRPLANVTLALNYSVSGTSPVGYHLTNLIIHLLCALLVFLVLEQLLQHRAFPQSLRTERGTLALLAALLWVVHPLTGEVVNYVTQRTESLMTLFYLLTLYAAMRALRTPGRLWPALSVLSCLLGALCKETIVTAPLAMFAIDSLLVFGSWREAWTRRRGLYLALASCWIVLAALQATNPRPYSTGLASGIDPWTYLLNQAVMLTRYARLVVWPTGLAVFYGAPLPLSLGDVAGRGLAVVALLGATIVSCWRWPPLGLAGVWFFLTLAPTSSVLPIATEVGAERRMYLPLIALAAIAVITIWRLAGSRRITAGVTAVLVLTLGVTTFARNREYAEPLRLAELTLARWPSGMAELLVAETLINAGRTDEAMPHLRAAAPDAPRAHYALGLQAYRAGQLEEAVREFQLFVRRDPLYRLVPDAIAMSARALATLGRWDEALTAARDALAKSPGHPTALLVVAAAQFNASRLPEAIDAYRQYLAVRPNDIDATTNLAISLATSGRLEDAVTVFRRAADLDPSNWQTRRNLAVALLDAGRPEESIREIRRALALRPDDSVSYSVLGQGLGRTGQLEPAVAAFERAVQLDSGNAEAAGFLQQLRRR